MTILQQTSEKKKLLKLYINFLNFCKSVDGIINLAKEIQRLQTEIIILEQIPIKKQLINNEPYFVIKKSKKNKL
jgi:hypothetical protein